MLTVLENTIFSCISLVSLEETSSEVLVIRARRRGRHLAQVFQLRLYVHRSGSGNVLHVQGANQQLPDSNDVFG